MRLDPALTRDDTLAALLEDARRAWGDSEVEILRSALEVTADALRRLAQEPLELTDDGPWEA